jgi:hypothetical protein
MHKIMDSMECDMEWETWKNGPGAVIMIKLKLCLYLVGVINMSNSLYDFHTCIFHLGYRCCPMVSVCNQKQKQISPGIGPPPKHRRGKVGGFGVERRRMSIVAV